MIVTSIIGNKFVSKGVQLTQSSFTPLELCYIYLGLGRTNNYVESLTVGIPAVYKGDVIIIVHFNILDYESLYLDTDYS